MTIQQFIESINKRYKSGMARKHSYRGDLEELIREHIKHVFEEGDLRGFETLVGLPKGRVWINAEQYFENIPLTAWEFYIGGYQPAQKWLKDRKERELSFDDILHYQKKIVALSETDRLMREIDKIEIE